MNEAQMNFEGAANPKQHRTVGPHRAYCLIDLTWCYPDDICDCCHEALGHTKIWNTP